MKARTDSDERELLEGNAEQKRTVEPWNNHHLGVVADVYHRSRPAPDASERDEPWNDPKLGLVAEVYGWCRKAR